jgi:hypothetical protein
MRRFFVRHQTAINLIAIGLSFTALAIDIIQRGF